MALVHMQLLSNGAAMHAALAEHTWPVRAQARC